jgi:hypothetical protein
VVCCQKNEIVLKYNGSKRIFLVVMRDFLVSQEENACHKKKIPNTEIKCPSQKENSCHRKNIPERGRTFL